MRLFLGTHRAGFALVGIVEAGFLIDFAARFDDCDLAFCFNIDGLLNEAHGVHVLDLAARAKVAEITRFDEFLVLARQTDRDVDVGAHAAALHIAVAGAQITQDLAQFDHEGSGFFGAANIWARDDLH